MAMENGIIYLKKIVLVLTTLSCMDKKDEAIDEPIDWVYISAMVTVSVRNELWKLICWIQIFPILLNISKCTI